MFQERPSVISSHKSDTDVALEEMWQVYGSSCENGLKNRSFSCASDVAKKLRVSALSARQKVMARQFVALNSGVAARRLP
jgi:hypothetical protein